MLLRVESLSTTALLLSHRQAQFSCVHLFATPWTAAHELPCPSSAPRVHPNPCPLRRWCHPTISSCHPLLLLPSIFSNIRVFPNESVLHISSVLFISVAKSCPTLCNPMNHSTPGLPVHHQLLEFTQTHVHRVGDAIQPSHPPLSPSSPAPNPSQHQNLHIR